MVAVTEPAAFHSREPAPDRQEARRHSTGRNIQPNLKVRQKDADAFYALADKRGWVLGGAFQMAVQRFTDNARRLKPWLASKRAMRKLPNQIDTGA